MGAVVKIRLAQTDNCLDLHKAVCVAVFNGNRVGGAEVARETFGANRVADAMRLVRRLAAQGQAARAEWTNVGPWCAELWTQDLMRPFGMHPARFYGALEDAEECTGVRKRP